MWVTISLVCSSHISCQLFRLFPFSFPICSRWFAISSSLFLFSVANFLPTPAIVVVSLVSRLLQGYGRIIVIFGVSWVQLSQNEYFISLHLANPRNCVDLRHSQLFLLWSMQWITSLLPFLTLSFSLHPGFSSLLDGWSAGTGCAAFHLSTTSLVPTISSACTLDRFSQSFHLTKFIHRPSIY